MRAMSSLVCIASRDKAFIRASGSAEIAGQDAVASELQAVRLAAAGRPIAGVRGQRFHI